MSEALLRCLLDMHMWLGRLTAKNSISGFAPVLSRCQTSPFNSLQVPLGKPRAWRIRLQLAIRNGRAVPPQGPAMNGNSPTYRVEIKQSGTAPNRGYGWQIYKNTDVLPILRSQQLFVSRMAGLADANRSRRQLVDADLQKLQTKEKWFY